MSKHTRWVIVAVGFTGLVMVGWWFVGKFHRPGEVVWPTPSTSQHVAATGPVLTDPTVEVNIQLLSTPEGKVKYHGSISPGGPILDYSVPMKALVERGNAIQGRLLDALQDPNIRNEIALVLAQSGSKDALPHLIEYLPTKEELTRDEDFSTMCLLYALWQLTGMELGIHHKFSRDYTPAFRTQWQTWYEANKDYLYTPTKPKRTAYSWGRDRVLVDVEAKLVSRPTAVYREEHPWIDYEEIKSWRDDAAYERKLANFCFSLIVNLSWNAHGYAPREAIRSLGRIHDPRAIPTLHALCALAEDEHDAHDLIRTLEERADPSSIAILEKIPRAKDAKPEADANGSRRSRAIERIRLLEKYGKELKDKPFDAELQTQYMHCLEGPKGVEELLANLRNRKYDVFLSRYLRVAGFVDREPVRACLKEMAVDAERDERAKTMVHGALARLGEKDSLEHLKKSLTHKQPGVRLAAAEGLWGVGNREGFKTLVELLDLRPIETGGEGVEVGDGVLKVTSIREANVEYIRSACTILGEMGDRSAIEPLKRLLPLNLNGVAGGGAGSGTGWRGRPDAVALAKLGDFSGIAILRQAISEGDRLDITGDFVEIGRKRFIPELLPLLDHHDESKRVLAAQAILLLLERGR
jgi:HEAT repeat protein